MSGQGNVRPAGGGGRIPPSPVDRQAPVKTTFQQLLLRTVTSTTSVITPSEDLTIDRTYLIRDFVDSHEQFHFEDEG